MLFSYLKFSSADKEGNRGWARGGGRMERMDKIGKGCDDKTTLIPDVSYLNVRATFDTANFELTPR